MSDTDELLTGRDAVNAEAGFQRMAEDPRRAKDPDEQEWSQETYETDQLQDLAKEVNDRRAKERSPLVERSYHQIGGEHDGEPVEDNRTITRDRFVDDLKAARDAEVDAIVQAEDRVVADAIDGVKGIPTQSEIEAAAAQYQAHQAQLAAQQQAQQQTEPLPEGVNPELYKLLRENPAVSQALQAELNQVEAARKQYATAAWQSAQIAAASLVASEPMLQGISHDQMGVALQLIERQSPEKAAAVREHLGRVQNLYNIAVQAKNAQAQIEQQQEAARLQGYVRGQEVLFEHSIKSENPETVRQVKAEIGNIIEKDYGISREDLAQAVRTNPALHSAAFQKMMFDAAKYKIAQRTAMQNPARAPLPAVQKPGVSRGGHYDSDVESSRAEFLKRPTARSAAAFIASRRRSA